MQTLLVQQLGELDRVWKDSQLSQVLLQLPLPAVLLLLLSAQRLKLGVVHGDDQTVTPMQACLVLQQMVPGWRCTITCTAYIAARACIFSSTRCVLQHPTDGCGHGWVQAVTQAVELL